MTDIGEIVMRIEADITNAQKNLKEIQKEVKATANTTETAGKNITGTNTTISKSVQTASKKVKTSWLEVGQSAALLGLSIYALYDSYDNVAKSQTAVKKTALALSKANENVQKSQDDLNEAIEKYGEGSDEAETAALNLEQALEQQQIATEKADMATGNLDDAMVQFVLGGAASFLGIVAGGAGLISSIKGLTGALPTLGTAVSGIGSTFKLVGSAMISPVGIALMAIAGIAAIIMANWDSFGPFFEGIWKGIQDTVGAVWNWLDTKVFQPLVGWFEDNFGPVETWGGKVEQAWNDVKTGLEIVYNWLNLNVFTPLSNIWGDENTEGTLANDVKKLKDSIVSNWNTIKTTIGDTYTWLDTYVFKPWSSTLSQMGIDSKSMSNNVSLDFNNLSWKVSPVMWALQSLADSGIFDGLVSTAKGATGKVIGIMGQFWGFIEQQSNSALGSLKEFGTNSYNTMTSAFQGIVSTVSEKARQAFSNIVSFAMSSYNTVVSTMNGIISAVQAAINKINELVKKVSGGGINVAGLLSSVSPVAGGLLKALGYAAEGAVVTKPSLWMVGEKHETEYIIPQSKLGSFMAAQSSTGYGGISASASGGSGSRTIINNFNVSGAQSPEATARAIYNALKSRGITR